MRRAQKISDRTGRKSARSGALQSAGYPPAGKYVVHSVFYNKVTAKKFPQDTVCSDCMVLP